MVGIDEILEIEGWGDVDLGGSPGLLTVTARETAALGEADPPRPNNDAKGFNLEDAEASEFDDGAVGNRVLFRGGNGGGITVCVLRAGTGRDAA